VVRTGTDAAGPHASAAGEVCVIPGLRTPLGSAGSAAWLITVAFETPCKIPSSGFLAVGIRVTPNAGWARTDGQSLHMSDAGVQQSGPHLGDHAWQIIGAGTSAIHFGTKRSIRIRALTGMPVLQNGVFATGTNSFSRGMGGMFPPARTHGWSTHIDGAAAFANGFAVVFLSPARLEPGVVVPGMRGLAGLGTPLVLMAITPLGSTGAANVKLMDPVAPYAATVHLQALLVNRAGAALTFTNANATTFP
jgi:hypothetical protein